MSSQSQSQSSSSSSSTHHSAPIPINTTITRSRIRSVSESSESEPVPPLSPSHSPASSASITVTTPLSPSVQIPMPPASPTTSPIMSYLYGPANKSPFTPRAPAFDVHAEEDANSQDPLASMPHRRRMSTSWIPARLSQQQQNKSPTEAQHDRGVGIMRRLSLSTPLTSKPSAPAQNTAKRDEATGSPRSPRKAATLSPGTTNKPRAPSPMGERMLKGHYDGF
ncbi:hypothetical protein BU17DRAFT_41104 [Hysterangium stoloniferum]|nr:hypothetical protein BU17DRAFT_41104 [Hysterangium stoloniferum]